MDWQLAWGVLLLSHAITTTWACDEGEPCTTDDGLSGYCLSYVCREDLHLVVRDNLTFTVTVNYPERTLLTNGGSSLFIRGNGLGLSWFKGRQLTKISNDTWQTPIQYLSSIDGFRCQNCPDRHLLPGSKFQYRILVDDTVDMLGANFAVHFPISKSSADFSTKPDFVSYPWFYTKYGEFNNITIEAPQIGGNRTVSYYFPPSFHENIYKTYPVLFVTDLKVGYAKIKPFVFEGLMYPSAVTEEFVVIAFEDYQDRRTTLLTTPVGTEMYCKYGTYSDNCNNCYGDNITSYTPAWFQILKDKCGYRYFTGGKCDDTIDFLWDTVYPKVQGLTNNRLSQNRNKIGLMGYSHGGLLSCRAAWTRPQHFGFASCGSASFWWPFNNDTWTTCDFDFFNNTLKDPKYLQNRPPQRIYIDVGGAETSAPYNELQISVEVAEYLNTLAAFEMNKNLWLHVYPGQHHGYYNWLKRVWQAMRALLPAQGDPAMPATPGVSIIG